MNAAGGRAQSPSLTFKSITARPVVLKLERPIVARIGTFTDWPLMHGRVIPDLSETTRVLQFSHRVVAALVGLFVGYVVIEARRRTGAIRRLGELAGALFVVEIIVGGLNVMTRLHSAVVTTHLALSSLIWGTLVTLVAVARRTPVPEALAVPRFVDARPASSVADRLNYLHSRDTFAECSICTSSAAVCSPRAKDRTRAVV